MLIFKLSRLYSRIWQTGYETSLETGESDRLYCEIACIKISYNKGLMYINEAESIMKSNQERNLPVKVKGARMPTVSAKIPPIAGPARPPSRDAACKEADYCKLHTHLLARISQQRRYFASEDTPPENIETSWSVQFSSRQQLYEPFQAKVSFGEIGFLCHDMDSWCVLWRTEAADHVCSVKDDLLSLRWQWGEPDWSQALELCLKGQKYLRGKVELLPFARQSPDPWPSARRAEAWS